MSPDVGKLRELAEETIRRWHGQGMLAADDPDDPNEVQFARGLLSALDALEAADFGGHYGALLPRLRVAEAALEAAEAAKERWAKLAYKGRDELLYVINQRDQAIKERDEARREFGFLYDAVSDAEKIDTNAGDSAVSVVLWSFSERRSLLAGVPGGSP